MDAVFAQSVDGRRGYEDTGRSDSLICFVVIGENVNRALMVLLAVEFDHYRHMRSSFTDLAKNCQTQVKWSQDFVNLTV
jgi:hypothetical protein